MSALKKAFPPLRLLGLISLLGLAPQLQGCLPLVAGGAGATALVLTDRRSGGAQTEDKEIDVRGESRINDAFGDKVHINVTSYNRNVLLTGEAQDEATKAKIESIVRDIRNVRGVVNEIQIAGVSTYAATTAILLPKSRRALSTRAADFRPTTSRW